tara:strand:- start:746 stop:1288 length:543 start_codon:yes stop_codon:yes gene_type:complete
MAKKKSKIPAYVLKQFDRALYKVGDKVVITWLGQIKQGHVTKFKKTNWGVSYTVDVAQESTKARNQITRYPCGIQIKEHTTDYDVGLILHDRTQAGDFPADTGIYGYSGSGKNESRNDDSSIGRNDNGSSRKNVKSRKSVTTATNTKSSSTRVRNSNTEIRSLDKAIDRQRDFLNGFVKK